MKKLLAYLAVIVWTALLIGAVASVFIGCPPNTDNVVVRMDVSTNMVANEFCPADVVKDRAYKKGTEPTEICTTHKKPEPPVPVSVVVCKTSGQIPNLYCPESESRDFLPADVPIESCNVHHKPAPAIKVYVEALDFMGALGDWSGYIKNAKANGAYGFRFIICYSWQGKQPLPPYAQISSWTHENGDVFPLYRLSTWNELYWQKLRDVLGLMAISGLEAWLVVEDYCSLKGDQHVKYFNPFYSSEEALSPATPGGVWGDAMKPYHYNLIERTVQVANASAVNFKVEPMNEMNIVGGTPAEAVAWHGWAVEALVKCGIPKSRIVGTSESGVNIMSQVGLYSPHGIGRPDQITPTFGGVPAAAIIYSSDGAWGIASTDCDAKGRCGVGLAQAPGIRDKIKAVGAYAYSWLPRGAYRLNNDRATLELVSMEILRSLAGI